MKQLSTILQIGLVTIAIQTVIGCASSNYEEEGTAERQRQAQQAEAAQVEELYKGREANDTIEMQMMSMTETAQVEMIAVQGSRMIDMPIHGDVYAQPVANAEQYQDIEENAVKVVSQSPVSTFSVDVDTGSYANVRRMLVQGYQPPSDAIRVEEFINYFDYHYPQDVDMSEPFSVHTAMAIAPWNDQRHLIKIGLQGIEGELKSAGKNLVFLLDVSGSMNQPDKLPLLKRSLSLLTKHLTEQDKVSIVVYAGASGMVLEPTSGNNRAKIDSALQQLSAGGSTNGASGIQLAYDLAQQSFIEGGVNRVILATDGDFNVGITDHNSLIELIEQKREKGIALTTLGFGKGNYNDYLMEQLADAGNGNYAYIDTINEARKVLVDELSATMQIIAKDVKVQVEFNPKLVAEYRLIGYENRILDEEDFNNDKVDAGDIGAGHTVTALYEVTLVDSKDKYNDDLRYQLPNASSDISGGNKNNEIAYVKLRYKTYNNNKASDKSILIDTVINTNDILSFEDQDSDFKFATAVAGFAQLMKNSKYAEDFDFTWVLETANNNKGNDEFGYRTEFVQLVRNAQELVSFDGAHNDSSETELVRYGNR